MDQYTYMITTQDSTTKEHSARRVAHALNRLVGQSLFTKYMVADYFTRRGKNNRINEFKSTFELTREKRHARSPPLSNDKAVPVLVRTCPIPRDLDNDVFMKEVDDRTSKHQKHLAGKAANILDTHQDELMAAYHNPKINTDDFVHAFCANLVKRDPPSVQKRF